MGAGKHISLGCGQSGNTFRGIGIEEKKDGGEVGNPIPTGPLLSRNSSTMLNNIESK